jgi:hypothetical protein
MPNRLHTIIFYCLILHAQDHIEKEMSKELKKDAALAGGALLAIGGIVGLAFALAKK